jgi:imidazolonepropionase-like amidohydrolase
MTAEVSSLAMERTILVGAMLIDGTGARTGVGARGGRRGRTHRGGGGRARGRAGATVRLDGFTLLPGLINCTRISASAARPIRPPRCSRSAYAATVIKAVQRARETVEAGVTTVRDLGGRDYAELSVRDAVRAGTIVGPRMQCAGRGICITGGHGWHLIGRESDGPDDVRKGVREQIKAGADVIKLFATGGVMTPGVDPNSASSRWTRCGPPSRRRARPGVAPPPTPRAPMASPTASRAGSPRSSTGSSSPRRTAGAWRATGWRWCRR